MLLSHRVSKLEKDLEALREAHESKDAGDAERHARLDRRLLKLEHFFEFANRYLTRR